MGNANTDTCVYKCLYFRTRTNNTFKRIANSFVLFFDDETGITGECVVLSCFAKENEMAPEKN